MKSRKQKSPFTYTPTMATVIVILLLIQVVFLVALWRDNRALNKVFSMFSDNQLNNDGDLFEVRPIIDPASKRLYLPGFDLYLPLTPESINLTYSVADVDGGGTADLVFMSRINNSVASLRSSECRDLVRIEIGANESKPRSGETTKEPIRLVDGRLIHTYLPENTSICQGGLPVLPQEAEAIVRRLQSY